MRPTRIFLMTAYTLALALAGGVALGQAPAAPPAAAGTEAPRPHTHMTLAERFAAANTTKDGHLTLEQARAGLPSVARRFAAIDKDNKGYVTLDEIHVYYKEQRAAHRQTAPNSSSS